MAAQNLPLQTAYVCLAVEMDEQPVWSTTTTYIEAGALTTGVPAKAALYFGELSGLTITKLVFNICRQDTYAAHVLNVAAASNYLSNGTSLGNFTFSNGQGTWTRLDLTNYISTIQSAPYIRLTHGSGSSWSSFYKTGANAPYLEITTSDDSGKEKTVRIYPQIPSDGIDGYLNGAPAEFIDQYMYAGKTGSSTNNSYISCNEFDLTPYAWKNISKVIYSVKNVNAGNNGGNSANLTANVTIAKEKDYKYTPAGGSAPIADQKTISRSVGTRTQFNLTVVALTEMSKEGLTYVYLGGPASDVNNSYKEFGGPDNINEESDDRPYIEITYTENYYVMYEGEPCEVYYCADGATWTRCMINYSNDGEKWTECGL